MASLFTFDATAPDSTRHTSTLSSVATEGDRHAVESSYGALKAAMTAMLDGDEPPATHQVMGWLNDSMTLHHKLACMHSSILDKRLTTGWRQAWADSVTVDSATDDRFTPGQSVDRLENVPPSLTLHLYPTHFKLAHSTETFSYDGPMKVFLEAVEQQTLLPDLLDILDDAQIPFYDGCLMVEVHDHRQARPVTGMTPRTSIATSLHIAPLYASQADVWRVLLQPTQASFVADMERIRIRSVEPLTDDALLEIESRILLASEDAVCLDPSPHLSRIMTILHYNQKKYSASSRTSKKAKRQRVGENSQKTSEDSFENVLLASANDSNGTKTTRFRQLNLVEEVRTVQDAADRLPAVGIDETTKTHRTLTSKGIKQLIRTLKFAKKSAKTSVYTVLNIYVQTGGEFEAYLRWGTELDTAVGGKTLQFSIGDISTAENYVRNFVALYCTSEMHTLTLDQRVPSSEWAYLIGRRNKNVTAAKQPPHAPTNTAPSQSSTRPPSHITSPTHTSQVSSRAGARRPSASTASQRIAENSLNNAGQNASTQSLRGAIPAFGGVNSDNILFSAAVNSAVSNTVPAVGMSHSAAASELSHMQRRPASSNNAAALGHMSPVDGSSMGGPTQSSNLASQVNANLLRQAAASFPSALSTQAQSILAGATNMQNSNAQASLQALAVAKAVWQQPSVTNAVTHMSAPRPSGPANANPARPTPVNSALPPQMNDAAAYFNMHPTQVPEQYRLAYLRHQHAAIQKLNSLLTNQQMLAAAGISVDPNTYTMTQKTLQARQSLFQTAFALLPVNMQQLFLQQVQQQQLAAAANPLGASAPSSAASMSVLGNQMTAFSANAPASMPSQQMHQQNPNSIAELQLELQRRAGKGRGKK